MGAFQVIYVCSPLSGNIQENMKKAKEYAGQVKEVFGCRAIAPHGHLPKFMDDANEKEREVCIRFCVGCLECCDGIAVFEKPATDGMKKEIQRAYEMKLPFILCCESLHSIHDCVIVASVDQDYEKVVKELLQCDVLMKERSL
ncbi:DUF4406 domain-containing protein [Massilimaliae timonensis]|uniref:DUF4406 domain-containing protein n=1 Tax=Massiliimalia timonensis TaxID=1987501 RepID=A0A8J6TRU2_9FIRM|nr:DUF4406 domain-containing protein [Massiliimalia timonensis]MBC8611381.1 DUF4406 domain-containing protein [Massiliimalia timonensis]